MTICFFWGGGGEEGYGITDCMNVVMMRFFLADLEERRNEK